MLTDEQRSANIRANGTFGYEPFQVQSKSVNETIEEYRDRGGVVHYQINNKTMTACGSVVGLTTKDKSIRTCLDCRRITK